MRKLISTICALMLLPLLAAPHPAMADPYVDNAAVDELFAELRVADNEVEAGEISRQIWAYWFSPSDRSLAARMAIASQLMSAGNLNGSLVELDGIVNDFPDYAEGWNQRATLYYMMKRDDAALKDLGHVLDLEPRHFGALAGKGMIFEREKNYTAAL